MRRGGFLLVVLALSGCARTSSKDVLAEAVVFVKDQRLAEAEDLLRAYLLRNPNDAGAHFYLGRCFLNMSDFRPVRAEGEIQLALHLFFEAGRRSSVAEFSDEYFEFICHIESAKVSMRWLRVLMDFGASRWRWSSLIVESRAHGDKARQIRPNDGDVEWADRILDVRARA